MAWNRLMAWFRRKFLRISDGYTGQGDEQPSTVAPHELVTRFIHYSDHYAATKGRVKPAAIGPLRNPATGRLETSVFRADGVSSDLLWNICQAFVDDLSRGRAMKARGTCRASVFLNENLAFDADGTPHPRHANVIGWPESKHEQKNLQQKIAAQMTLELRPS